MSDVKKIIKIEKEQDELYVYWLISDFCNLSCNYCNPHNYEGKFHKAGVVTDEMLRAFAQRLINYKTSTNKFLNLCISGGEPTLHPLLPEIIETLKPYTGIMRVVTNGSRGLKWWQSLKELPTDVMFSLHPEYFEKYQSRIEATAKYLLSKNVGVFCTVGSDPKNWDKVTNVINTLDPELLPRTSSKILYAIDDITNKKKLPLTAEQIEFTKKIQLSVNHFNPNQSWVTYDDGTVVKMNPNKIIANNENYWEGWSCSGGSKSIQVRYNGDVVGGLCGQVHLGRMDNFELLTENIICKKVTCMSTGDVEIDKHRL